MPKKPEVISKEALALLRLLRIALQTEKVCPEAIEELRALSVEQWKSLVHLSYQQKVSALATDGLRALSGSLVPGDEGAVLGSLAPGDEDKSAGLGALLVPWFNDVDSLEVSCSYYLEVLNILCRIFIIHGLTPIILKGYGLSLNYPIPTHRGAGDIDIFLVDKDGKPAAERGVEIVENVLCTKTTKVPHDYEFQFKGIEVELHYDTTNAYWNTESENYIVRRLTELLLEDLRPCPDLAGVMLPGPTFNAAYLVRHMYGHFYTSSGNFRQYVDFMLFLKRYHLEVEWEKVNLVWIDSKMKPFANAMIAFLEEYFGMDKGLCPVAQYDSATTEHVIRNIFQPAVKGETVISRYSYYFRNRWKHKFLTGEGWITAFCKAVISSLNNRFK